MSVGARVLGTFVLLGFGLLVAWGAGELMVRFLIPTSTVAYRFDPEVGYTLEPNGRFRWVSPDYDVQVVTNGAGFHDVEHARAKPAGTYRIVVVGDSMVEALQVPVSQAFTRLLEERLGAWAAPRVEVINLGGSGKGPAQYHRLLERVGMGYEPDLVVITVTVLNDFLNDLPELERDPAKPYYRIAADGTLAYVPPAPESAASRERTERQRPGVWLKTRLKQSRFVKSALERWHRLRATWHPAAADAPAGGRRVLPPRSEWNVFLADPPPPWDEAYRVTLRVIEESDRLVRAHGARLLVVLIPPKALVEDKLDAALVASGLGGAGGLAWDLERPARAVEALGRARDIPVLDLGATLREDWARTRESASWEHDGHWSPRGHRLAADALDTYLHAHADTLGLGVAP